MAKIIGKGLYVATYEGKEYPKISFTLEDDSPRYSEKKGVLATSVAVKRDDYHLGLQVGDNVRVSYNRYGKIDTLIKI